MQELKNLNELWTQLRKAICSEVSGRTGRIRRRRKGPSGRHLPISERKIVANRPQRAALRHFAAKVANTIG